MSIDIFKQILQDHKELSSLPQTLAEVLRVTRDENSSAKELANVLLKDPAMTSKVLRVVNSAFYGAGHKITTMSQAVMTLGMRPITALALSTSIYDMTEKWQTTIDRKRFWRHSLEVALAARLIAERNDYERPEEVFVCGLLHDIGILVLENSFPDKFNRIWRQVEGGEKLGDLEESIWGTNHARVGQFLLEQWGLPSVISEAVGQHHNDMLCQSSQPEFRVSQMVALANVISRFTIAKTRPELAIEVERKTELVQVLQLQTEKLKQIEQMLFTRVTEEAKFLEIDIGSPEEILIEANAMIYGHYLAVENLLRENRLMQREMTQTQIEKASLEALKTVTATFNHYINNAAATILGRAQLVELKIRKGEITDKTGETAMAMEIIVKGVETISSVIHELKELGKFETTIYHDDMYIIDLESRLKKRVEELQSTVPVLDNNPA
ncbi:MAG: HDOD domain-containing protein [candidate division Zixibacteria bacterium]|nr:HDOD domain-containing protein [candidate division Zixibacteria bacterium]